MPATHDLAQGIHIQGRLTNRCSKMQNCSIDMIFNQENSAFCPQKQGIQQIPKSYHHTNLEVTLLLLKNLSFDV